MADSQTATSAPEFKSAHFIGIGGAGMSGIALVLHERGYAVTGSDLKTSRYIRQLTRAGVKVHVGHEAATIDEVKPDVVVVSTAIPESNPELVRARELGIPVWPRAKMLSALGHGYTTVAVAGTHGKTTTSSMCATMLDRMGLDPSFLIGGIVEGYDTNGKNGSGDYFVAEADESDSSFLFLNPNVVIVTNVEADHLDHYSGIEEIEATFAKFMSLVGEDGTVIVCGEDPHLVELAKSTGRHVLSYGFARATTSSACTRMSRASRATLSFALRTALSTLWRSRAIPVATTCSTPRRCSPSPMSWALTSTPPPRRSRALRRPPSLYPRGRYRWHHRGR